MRYSTLIEAYCKANGIDVPSGFRRHSASRYAVILRTAPPKLVAKTWFKQEDLVYYLKGIPPSDVLSILDFKEKVELTYEGGARLKKGPTIQVLI